MKTAFCVTSLKSREMAPPPSIFLFKEKKNIVVTPFKIQEIRDLVLAENVPSACVIQVD